jgi:hypothetical protein
MTSTVPITTDLSDGTRVKNGMELHGPIFQEMVIIVQR